MIFGIHHPADLLNSGKRIEQCHALGITHDIPDKVIVAETRHRTRYRKVQVGQDICFRMHGIGDSADYLSRFYFCPGFDCLERCCVRIDG